MTINIYELTWGDEFGAYAVCPDCHGTAYLLSENEAGHQEWCCEECWRIHDENGQFVRKFHRQGLEQQKCPECGDFRIDKDLYDGCYYCRNCHTAFRDSVSETSYEDGQPSGYRVVDLGPAEHPETCPNCHGPLRAQYFETPTGNIWAYPCKVCGIVYRSDADDDLVIPPICPKCGKYSLFRYSHKGEKFQKCEFCHIEFDLEGDYLHEADRPTHGNRQLPKSVLGFVSRNSNNAKPQ